MTKHMVVAGVMTAVVLASQAHGQSGGAIPNASQADAAATSAVGDIVVTARRRAENAQTVPVSITALSSAALTQKTVQQLDDLTAIAPGFRFSSEGGRNQQTLSLRGLGQVPVGEGVPAVVTYFAEVPLPKEGSNLPTFDLANIQVLKGPQGTLFGRNTIAGAVLVTPQAPTFEFGGYAKADYGNYDYKLFEGAVNIPLNSIAAVRIAGQYRKRDPITKNLEGGRGFGDIDQKSVRVSLLLQPSSSISNTLIADYLRAPQRPSAEVLYKYNPGILAAVFGPFVGAAIDPYEAQLAAYAAEQKANGPFKVRNNLNRDGVALPVSSDLKEYGFTNTTKVNLGNITIRNIFGYRNISSYQRVNAQGTGTLNGPLGPLILLHLTSLANKEYLTNEFQVLGDMGRLNWIAGAFYSHDNPTGNNGTVSQTFDFIGAGAHPAYGTSLVTDTNYAAFAQATYELLDGLKLTAGGRYSWDRISACGASNPTGFLSDSACRATAGLDLPDGVGVVKNKGSAPTWTLDADYRITKSVFIYVTAHHGYRGVNVNTPAFETPFTTGGTNPACLGPGNVCPNFLPFQKVKEEKVNDIEIGVKSTWRIGTTRVLANVAAYRIKYDNGIQFFNDVATGIPQSAPDLPTRGSIAINAANFTIQGIEADLAISPTSALTFSFNGAYTHQKIDKLLVPDVFGLSITRDTVTLPSPNLSGTAAVHYDLPVRPFEGTLSFDGDVYVTSKFDAQNGVPLPGYTLVNARLTLADFRGTGMSIALFTKNLLNRKYASAPSVLLPSLPTDSVFYGDPRTYGIEASYRF